MISISSDHKLVSSESSVSSKTTVSAGSSRLDCSTIPSAVATVDTLTIREIARFSNVRKIPSQSKTTVLLAKLTSSTTP